MSMRLRRTPGTATKARARRCCRSRTATGAATATAAALAIARIEAHYFVNDAFLAPDDRALGRRAHPAPALHDRPGPLRHRLPAGGADSLARAWPEAEYVVVPDAGHSVREPGITRAARRRRAADAGSVEAERGHATMTDTYAQWQARSRAAVWHPCTQMKQHERTAAGADRARPKARGCTITDGRRYLDAVSSWWVNLFGHANPRINAAIAGQLDELEHVMLAGFTHAPVVELSERLAALAPPGLGARVLRVRRRVGHRDRAEDELPLLAQARRAATSARFVRLAGGYHGETRRRARRHRRRAVPRRVRAAAARCAGAAVAGAARAAPTRARPSARSTTRSTRSPRTCERAGRRSRR